MKFFSTSAYVVLWSMAVTTLALLGGLMLGIAVEYSFFALVAVGISYWFALQTSPSLSIVRMGMRFGRAEVFQLLFIILGILIPVAIASIPFLTFHKGLPTGDVQKTIIFAEEILRTHRVPVYARSVALLNRDPVDFYTPGLHAVSALVMRFSPNPLMGIGIFSLVLAVCTAIIAAAIAQEVFPEKKYRFVPILSYVLVLTQFRFLRYIREPGYHFQNIAGEFFLFGLLFAGISFIRRRKLHDALLFFVCTAALLVSHQFSLFIAVWALCASAALFVVAYRSKILHTVRTHVALSGIAASGIALAGILGVSLGLMNKIPALFTLRPHLISQLPDITTYPLIMGTVWLISGLAGMALFCIHTHNNKKHISEHVLFISFSLAILALSQGPAFGVDIPPVRALFYSVVPFSITAAYFFITIARINKSVFAMSVVLVLVTLISSTSHAFTTLSHTVRTNSTLSQAQVHIIDALKTENNSTILIDDYNRRAASWLVLSGRPMVTRIAADLQRQMNESLQSPLRHQLYMNQLDYEKVFMLGSRPEALRLLTKHGIGAITGIEKSSKSAFSQNALLHATLAADDMVIFEQTDVTNSTCNENSDCEFLLRSTTLANDIGDDEDVFEHLQASVRSPRLSNPQGGSDITYRETNASHIPLVFNIDDYVRVLWDTERVGKPVNSLTFKLWLTRPVQNLSVLAPNGTVVPLQYQTKNSVMLTSDMATIDERGFITLTLLNPEHEAVRIDLIALGL